MNRDFDTTIVSYCNGDDPVVGVRRQYHSDQVRTTGFTNAAGYRNPQMDGLWNSAQREPDQARRAGFYREIQSLAVRDLPYFWLVETLGTWFPVQLLGLQHGQHRALRRGSVL